MSEPLTKEEERWLRSACAKRHGFYFGSDKEWSAVWATLDAVRAALRACEWGQYDSDWGTRHCPVCDTEPEAGHLPDCIVRRALASGSGFSTLLKLVEETS